MNHVIDVRAVRRRGHGVRRSPVATPSIFAAGSRRAIIAGRVNHSSGYLNMFKNLRSQSGEDIEIFSTVEDAHRWLGHRVSDVEPLPRQLGVAVHALTTIPAASLSVLTVPTGSVEASGGDGTFGITRPSGRRKRSSPSGCRST